MIPGSFSYHSPATVEEAVGLLAELGDDARPLAGGHSLLPMMKLRLAPLEHLVDLRKIDALKGIEEADGALVIGAMTTQADLLASGLVAGHCPIIQETAALIADPQVRYVGTLGGNVANGDPANDMPGVMQCLDASYLLTGKGGSREVKARDFYEGAFFTALQEGEILTAVKVPVPPAGHGYAYEKLKRKIGDYATAAAAVVLTMAGGTCKSASIALTNVGETPLYAAEASAVLVGSSLNKAAVDQAVSLAEGITAPASDGRGPAEYRTKMAGVMLRRAIQRAHERATG
ncbi:xanthine dehydrogenase family protein subunit M [Pelagibius sp. CAU 1746]|uniref:FAD binding domain-containing protein n=1 Tax=Pelagibius sp. CAU 1746 TaxID=3140370 RepID=UPI00325BA549